MTDPLLGESPDVANTPEKGAKELRRALLDTTVQLDRQKGASRRTRLEAILGSYDLTFSTGMSLVEFKATIIAECILIHNQMRMKGARFTYVRDALLEKKGQQISLRSHIFNNLIQVFASSFSLTPERDEKLAEKARLQLENIIPKLFAWFAKGSVDCVLNDRLMCNRATESPRKKVAAFDTNLPKCARGRNKTCKVEELIRLDGAALIDRLTPHLSDSDQFQNAIQVFRSVIANPNADLSHGDCRRAGDCLIALEARDKANHALSSNAKEWRPLSDIMGFEFIHITYPAEKSV